MLQAEIDHSDVHQGITDPAPKDMPDVAFISLAEAGWRWGSCRDSYYFGRIFQSGTDAGNLHRGHVKRRHV